jgi:anti-sigma28 factor (negative regulator of flagellin synthesis)
MIISRAEINSAISAYRQVKRKNNVSTVAYDTFEASNVASSLLELVQAVTAEPFYRPELVEDLRRRIAEGRYFVPAEEIVEKLLGRLIAEHASA